MYGNCENTSELIAKPGYCNNDCNHVTMAYVVFFFAFMLSVGPTIVIPTILLRSTSEESKPLVLATKMFVGKLLGGIPGPVIWGGLIDDSCIKGKYDCNNNFLTCQIYDANDVTKRFIGGNIINTWGFDRQSYFKMKFFLNREFSKTGRGKPAGEFHSQRKTAKTGLLNKNLD